MKDVFTLTWTDATNLFEFVGKTVTVRTKHKHAFKGIVHTVDPITRSLVLVVEGRCQILSGVNIESVNTEKS